MCTRRAGRTPIWCALAALTTACSGPPGAGRLPGADLGGFRVAATEVTNGCGAGALGSPPRFNFEIDLSRDGDELFWGREASGAIDAELGFEFTALVRVEVAAASASRKGCTIGRADYISGTLRENALGSIDGFSGNMSHSFSSASDSACSIDDRIEAGLPELPCQMAYTLEAQLTRTAE